MTTTWILIIAGILCVAVFLVVSRYFTLWLQAYVSGTQIHLLSLVLMSLRNVAPQLVVQCKVMLVQAGVAHVSTNAIEAHVLANGDVERVTLALIAAHRSGIKLDWNTAAAIDLAGRDILEAVRVSVNPKVIYCPDPAAGAGGTLSGVAKDGIELNVRACVTVRTNLDQLIGGATEPTVIARIGQAIVTAIGHCDCYQEALADPLRITRQALDMGLDSQTSFSVISIDIASINVGTNIGANLRIDQAKTDIRIARARAEKRRVMAVAREQEMKALTQENRALVVLAEIELPIGIAEAFRNGQFRDTSTDALKSERLKISYSHSKN
ncbi:flotillin-like FloA family protein [uncultured Rubinisphaera sp.]|uniref:flotillin-like FloA family protein n=3 Tax=Rubinisphaera TaxID=1649490 RepID=UPI0030D9CA81|tara:strand:- start:4936 stop:5910 length:975 start_codon:yes stop_codon:yes gene_type:complete